MSYCCLMLRVGVPVEPMTLQKIAGLPDSERTLLITDALKVTAGLRWLPNQGYNAAAPPQFNTDDGRIIDFGACARLGASRTTENR